MSNIIEQIQSRVKALFADEVVEEKMMVEAVVKDTGITIKADAWEVGQVVTTTTEEGDEIAMVEGTYEVEDGTILTIDSDGIITEIVNIEEETEVEVETEKVDEEMKSEQPTYVTEEQLAAAMSTMLTSLEKVMTRMSALTPKEEKDADKVEAENKLLKARLAEKRKAIAPKAEATKPVVRTQRAGHRSATLSRVKESLADFNFKLEKN